MSEAESPGQVLHGRPQRNLIYYSTLMCASLMMIGEGVRCGTVG